MTDDAYDDDLDVAQEAQAAASDRAVGEDVPFEALLERLEKIVEELEGGELRLEDALGQFEEGMGLAGQAERILEAAQLKVTKLIEARDGALREEPLDVA